MDPTNPKTIEALVKALEKVSEIIKGKEPDCIIAPMMGAIPFIDMLNIIDEEFPNHKVEYVPASNKIHRLRPVLRGAFASLIEGYAPNGGSFLSLDEVVSGNSLVRVYKQFDAARNNYATMKTKEVYGPETDFQRKEVLAFQQNLIDRIDYNSVGIVDPKLDRLKKKQNHEYLQLLERKIVTPVPTSGIVTMDRTGFFPAQYVQAQEPNGRTVYLPVVETFNVSNEYLNFLRTVAGIVGKNPDEVTVRNMGKIIASYQFVPESLRTL